jgi:hypothetical protein
MANTTDDERYGGKEVKIGGKTYLFAPISIGQMKRFMKAIEKIQGGDSTQEETLENSLAIIRASLQRNYPSMTGEWIEENIIDPTNLGSLFNVALEASGFKAGEKGKADAGRKQT